MEEHEFKDLNEYILCCLPTGWEIRFGEELFNDIKELCEKDKEFFLLDIKEKYGELEIYPSKYSEEFDSIERRYNELSKITCACCGAHATRHSSGWVLPLCDECFKFVS